MIDRAQYEIVDEGQLWFYDIGAGNVVAYRLDKDTKEWVAEELPRWPFWKRVREAWRILTR